MSIPTGRFDLLVIDGDVTDFCDDVFCNWIRLENLSWREVIGLGELALHQHLSLVLYPLEVEEVEGDATS